MWLIIDHLHVEPFMSYWKYENKLISSTRRPWSSISQCSLENIIYIVICYPLTFICCRLALKLKGLKVCGKPLQTCFNPGVCSEKFKEFLRAVTVPKNFGSGWSINISVRFRFSVRVFILWNPNLIHLNLLILPIFIPFFFQWKFRKWHIDELESVEDFICDTSCIHIQLLFSLIYCTSVMQKVKLLHYQFVWFQCHFWVKQILQHKSKLNWNPVWQNKTQSD